ncbi:MAG: hypothetical protein E7312_00240 [Clostridiales bacterium]|nr:hypothetical protein [Clostridiales bacterium]
MSEIQWDKPSFDLRLREYNNYFDLDGVSSYGDQNLKIITLYKDRESAINKDMFSVLKKILVECGDHENAIAYLDDNDIICVEFPNGDIIKQA